MERCLRCQGSKKIAPMGGIYVTCTVCHGVGFTQDQSRELCIKDSTIETGTYTGNTEPELVQGTESIKRRVRKTHQPYTNITV